MNDDITLRQEIRHSLRGARSLIHSYSGLYPGEDLARDVLTACDELMRPFHAHPRLEEARRAVEERCVKLVRAADRFAVRDPIVIAAFRAQAAASIDFLQDELLEVYRKRMSAPRFGYLLRERSR